MIAVGYLLGQLDAHNPAIRYFNRFGSITLNDREKRFSQAKLELYGLYRTLRALKMWLIGVRNLRIEVDARYIKGMLNNPDIAPSASINRWIVSILLFQFELVHVPGKTHGPDGLSRRQPQPGDTPEVDDQDEFDDWVDNMYGFTHTINPVPVPNFDPATALFHQARPDAPVVFDLATVDDDIPTVDRDELLAPLVEYAEIPRSPKAMRADAKIEFARAWLTTLRRLAELSDKDF